MDRERGLRQQRLDQLVDCLRRRGFDVAPALPGRHTIDAPPGADIVAFAQALAECGAEVGAIPNPPPTERNLRITYDSELRAAECIRSFGVEVPDPPSFEAWADAWRRGRVTWSPRANVHPDLPNYLDICTTCDPEASQAEPFEDAIEDV